jgi:hypothetical protein
VPTTGISIHSTKCSLGCSLSFAAFRNPVYGASAANGYQSAPSVS